MLGVGWLIYDIRRAGAQWRTHAKADEVEQQLWDAQTYREWMGIVRRGEGEAAGLDVSNDFRFYIFHEIMTLFTRDDGL